MTVDKLRENFPYASLTHTPPNTDTLWFGKNELFPTPTGKEVELRIGRRIATYVSADGKTEFPDPMVLLSKKEGWPQALSAMFKQLSDERQSDLRRAQSANANSSSLLQARGLSAGAPPHWAANSAAGKAAFSASSPASLIRAHTQPACPPRALIDPACPPRAEEFYKRKISELEQTVSELRAEQAARAQKKQRKAEARAAEAKAAEEQAAEALHSA